MSVVSPTRFSVEIGASRALAIVFAIFYGGAALLAALLPLPVWLRVLLAVVALVLAHDTLRRHAWRRSPRAVTALAITDDIEGCEIRFTDGVWQRADVLDRWVQPWLVIVRVRMSGHRWFASIVVASDAVDADTFRALRVRLRQRSVAAPK